MKKRQFSDKNALYLVILVLVGMIIGGWQRSENINDFNDYYNATKAFQQKEDLYHLEEARNFFQGVDFLDLFKGNAREKILQMKGKLGSYIYPPTFAFLLQPLGFLEYETAAKLFSLINILSFIGVVFLINKKFAVNSSPLKEGIMYGWKPVLFTLLICIHYIENHMNNNQVGMLLLFLILIALINTGLITGIFLSLAIAIKLTPAIFIFYLLATKKYKEIIYTGLFLLFWILLPFITGVDYNLLMLDNWYNLVLDKFIKNPIFRAWKNNQSLVATLAKYFFPLADPLNQIKFNLPLVQLSLGTIKGIYYAIIALILLPLGLKIKKGIGENQLIATLFIISILFSGISWIHSFIFMFFPVFYIVLNYNQMHKNDKIVFFLLVLTPLLFTQIAGDLFLMYSGLFYIGIGYYYLVLKYDENRI